MFQVTTNSYYLTLPHTLVLRHDLPAGGGLFPAVTADWNLNEGDPRQPLFSRLGDLPDLAGPGGGGYTFL